MGRRALFDRDTLAAAGLAVVERDGWNAISVRSVADEMGVTSMALYRVVADARHLRQVIADAAAPAVQPHAKSEPLVESLQTWGTEAYQQLGRFPGLASFVIREWTELPSWLDLVERLLNRADAEGLTGPPAVAAVNAVFAYVLARSQLRDAAADAPRRQLTPVRQEQRRYPLLRRNIAEYKIAQTDKHFEFGLDALIVGLGAFTPHPRRASTTR